MVVEINEKGSHFETLFIGEGRTDLIDQDRV
jgi:hypothetical protein